MKFLDKRFFFPIKQPKYSLLMECEKKAQPLHFKHIMEFFTRLQHEHDVLQIISLNARAMKLDTYLNLNIYCLEF